MTASIVGWAHTPFGKFDSETVESLVVRVEQMTRTPAAEIGRNLLRASYLPEDGDTPGGFAGVFGKIAQAYFQKYGDQSDALAMIAAKNHKNGVANPYAQMREDYGC